MDSTPPDGPTPGPNPFEPPATPVAIERRKPAPMPETLRALGCLATLLASLIAFVATCTPLGFLNVSLDHRVKAEPKLPGWLPWAAGLAAGVLAGWIVARGWGWAWGLVARRRPRPEDDSPSAGNDPPRAP